MSRPRRPLPVYFRKRNIFPFFLFQLSVHTLTTFSGTTNTGFRKRSTELRFWKQRLAALMYWRAKTENFKRWCHAPYHKQCAFSLRDALLHRSFRVDRGKRFVDVHFYENGETNLLFLKISGYLQTGLKGQLLCIKFYQKKNTATFKFIIIWCIIWTTSRRNAIRIPLCGKTGKLFKDLSEKEPRNL